MSEIFHNNNNGAGRNLDDAAACDEILATWDVEDVTTYVSDAIDANLQDSTAALGIKFALLPSMSHGVQIRKLCAKCTDFPSLEEQDFCSPTAYGSNVLHSGLALIPLSNDSSILPGTHVGAVYCHGTSTSTVPTTLFNGADSGLDILLNVALASNGTVVLMPDYMGYGESSGIVSKGYLVKQQYMTSVVPLWLQTQLLMEQESNCQAALADSAVVFGYSEGGYASVAIANALHSIGIDIVKVEAGGGPYRTGSAALLKAIESADNQSFPLEVRHYFALLGAAYSSTYASVANFHQHQDLLNTTLRNTIVALVDRSASTSEVRNVISTDDPLAAFNQTLLAFARQAIADGDKDPCGQGKPIVRFERQDLSSLARK